MPMMMFTPYRGSLLRLAFTTVAIFSLAAVAFSAWQESSAHRSTATLEARAAGSR